MPDMHDKRVKAITARMTAPGAPFEVIEIERRGARMLAFRDAPEHLPALFDRYQPNFESGYTPPEIEKARTFVAKPDWDAMLRDTQAAIDAVKSVGPVGIIGFCLGGSIAFVAATRLSGLKAAIGYYGGAVVRFADEKPKVPTQLHFGEKDAGIPLTDVETIKAKRPDVEVFVYPGAQHGFHCDERASYDKASADIAWPRSMEFFAKHLR